jgi:hypothetical protein
MGDSDKPVTLDDVMRQVRENGRFLEEIRGVIHDLQVENTELKKVVKELKDREADLMSQVTEAKQAAKVALSLANEADQYNRRSNLRIYGIPEKPGEQQKDVEDLVLKVCADLKLTVTNKDIEACHRLGRPNGRPNPDGSGSHGTGGTVPHRGIIVRFMNRKHRDEMIKNRRALKNTKVVVTEDLTNANYKLFQAVRNSALCDKTWTTNGKVLMKCKNGKIVQVHTTGDLIANQSIWSK